MGIDVRKQRQAPVGFQSFHVRSTHGSQHFDHALRATRDVCISTSTTDEALNGSASVHDCVGGRRSRYFVVSTGSRTWSCAPYTAFASVQTFQRTPGSGLLVLRIHSVDPSKRNLSRGDRQHISKSHITQGFLDQKSTTPDQADQLRKGPQEFFGFGRRDKEVDGKHGGSPAASERPPPMRILILMSDTGGGHRASAVSLKGAITQMYGVEKYDVNIMDLWSDHTVWPINQLPKLYTFLASHPFLWKFVYNCGSDEKRMLAAQNFVWRLSSHKMTRAIENYNPDLVVSVHPLMQVLPLRILERMQLKKQAAARGEKPKFVNEKIHTPPTTPPVLSADRVPFVTVVTDLASAHSTWFDPRVDRCYVPSPELYKMALDKGISVSQLRQYGLPIRLDFSEPALPKKILRQAFNLIPDVPVVLLVGGGDGVGRVEHIAKAVALKFSQFVRKPPTPAIEPPPTPAAGGASPVVTSPAPAASNADRYLPSAQLVVVCGKNKSLKRRLEQQKWPIPVIVNGFVNNMSDWMAASDCVITKAGPGTIAEAMSRGLPICLSGFLPGQEEGNVPFVVENGFGAFETEPDKIAETVQRWLSDEGVESLRQMSSKALHLAGPRASFRIAEDFIGLLQAQKALQRVAAPPSIPVLQP